MSNLLLKKKVQDNGKKTRKKRKETWTLFNTAYRKKEKNEHFLEI